MQESLMSPVTSLVRRMCTLLAISAAPLVAQRPASARIPAGERMCDMSVRVVAMRLVDASGAPVPDAKITVRRIRTRALLERVESMGPSGDYRIAEDGDLRDLRAGGEPFAVTFTKGGTVRTVRIVLGMDAGGCHVSLLRGPTTVRF